MKTPNPFAKLLKTWSVIEGHFEGNADILVEAALAANAAALKTVKRRLNEIGMGRAECGHKECDKVAAVSELGFVALAVQMLGTHLAGTFEEFAKKAECPEERLAEWKECGETVSDPENWLRGDDANKALDEALAELAGDVLGALRGDLPPEREAPPTGADLLKRLQAGESPAAIVRDLLSEKWSAGNPLEDILAGKLPQGARRFGDLSFMIEGEDAKELLRTLGLIK
jgi:hypothetical protein